MREIRLSGSGEGAVQSRPYLITRGRVCSPDSSALAPFGNSSKFERRGNAIEDLRAQDLCPMLSAGCLPGTVIP
jgi:hypothetical protein